MTFELLPDITPFVNAFFAVAAVAILAAVAVAVEFFVVNRRERVARSESITTYYGQLHFAH
jgi:hypothetical protein